MRLFVKRGYAIGGDLHGVTANSGLVRQVHHTDIGTDARHDKFVWAQRLEAFLKGCAQEATEAILGDDFLDELLKLRDDLRLLCPSNAVGRV